MANLQAGCHSGQSCDTLLGLDALVGRAGGVSGEFGGLSLGELGEVGELPPPLYGDGIVFEG